MINVCQKCGQYQADKEKVIDGLVRCNHCGYESRYAALPLFLVGGASAAGKTTLCQYAVGKSHDVVLLDMDILWSDAFNTPHDHYRPFFETWLRMAKNIHLSGRSVILFGAGACIAKNIEDCIESRYFSEFHYLALRCDEAELQRRLLERPKWRGCSAPEFVSQQISFNTNVDQQKESQGNLSIIDTTYDDIEKTHRQFVDWYRSRI